MKQDGQTRSDSWWGVNDKHMLTIVVVVDSYISRSRVHDLVGVCGESLLVTRWQWTAFVLEFSNQLRRHATMQESVVIVTVWEIQKTKQNNNTVDNEGSSYSRLWPQVLPGHQTDIVTRVWKHGKKPARVKYRGYELIFTFFFLCNSFWSPLQIFFFPFQQPHYPFCNSTHFFFFFLIFLYK